MTENPITLLAVRRTDGETDYLRSLPTARGLVCRIVGPSPGLLVVEDTLGRGVAAYAPGAWRGYRVLVRVEAEGPEEDGGAGGPGDPARSCPFPFLSCDGRCDDE